MKKLKNIILIVYIILFTSCSGNVSFEDNTANHVFCVIIFIILILVWVKGISDLFNNNKK